MPSNESQVLAGGSAQDRNASAVDRSLATRSDDGEARKDCESITTPRYWTTWEGKRCDFSGFTTIPSSRQRSRTTLRSRRRDSREDDWTSQSSRYRLMRIPQEWRMAETGAMTHEKTCGAVERPKQRAENW